MSMSRRTNSIVPPECLVSLGSEQQKHDSGAVAYRRETLRDVWIYVTSYYVLLLPSVYKVQLNKRHKRKMGAEFQFLLIHFDLKRIREKKCSASEPGIGKQISHSGKRWSFIRRATCSNHQTIDKRGTCERVDSKNEKKKKRMKPSSSLLLHGGEKTTAKKTRRHPSGCH
jgi:hypothetical protein